MKIRLTIIVFVLAIISIGLLYIGKSNAIIELEPEEKLPRGVLEEDAPLPFNLNDPNVIVYYPTSSEGHTSTSPLFFHTILNKGVWTPNYGDAGIYVVKFYGRYEGSIVDTQTMTIIVTETNRPPYIMAKFIPQEQ